MKNIDKQEQLIKFGIALKNRRNALKLSLRDVEKCLMLVRL